MLYVGTGITAGWHVETQLSAEGGGTLLVRNGQEPWQTVMTVPSGTGKDLTFALLNAGSDSIFAMVAAAGTLDGAADASPEPARGRRRRPHRPDALGPMEQR